MSELNKFSAQIIAFRDKGILPQGDVKDALADYYEANFKREWGVTKINRGCPSCISDMMKCLQAELRMVNFKGVPQTPKEMKWAELKKHYTKVTGNSAHGKKKAEILSELNG